MFSIAQLESQIASLLGRIDNAHNVWVESVRALKVQASDQNLAASNDAIGLLNTLRRDLGEAREQLYVAKRDEALRRGIDLPPEPVRRS